MPNQDLASNVLKNRVHAATLSNDKASIENNSKIITGSEEKNTRLRSRNIELLNKYHENQEFSFQVKDEILKTSGMRCEKA